MSDERFSSRRVISKFRTSTNRVGGTGCCVCVCSSVDDPNSKRLWQRQSTVPKLRSESTGQNLSVCFFQVRLLLENSRQIFRVTKRDFENAGGIGPNLKHVRELDEIDRFPKRETKQRQTDTVCSKRHVVEEDCHARFTMIQLRLWDVLLRKKASPSRRTRARSATCSGRTPRAPAVYSQVQTL